jgi:hypothetical protein
MAMKTLSMLKGIGTSVLLVAALSGVASANDSCNKDPFLWVLFGSCKPVVHGGSPVAAPEIDPGSAMAGLTLVMGGLAVIRSRRSKKLAD